MKQVLIIGISALLGALGALAQTHPNFSGTWNLDPLRGRYFKVPPPKSGTLHIEHQEPKLRFEMNSVTAKGPLAYMLETTTDGAITKQTLAGNPCIVSADWGNRTGERLIVETNCETPEGPVVMTRVLKLGSKGKMLTTILTIKDKSGQKQVYEFYARQPSS